MTAESNSEERLCLICLSATEGIGPASIARLADGARERGAPLAAVFDLPAEELEQEFGLGAQVAGIVASIGSPFERAEGVLDELDHSGGRAILRGAEQYPEKLDRHLGAAAPPVLFVLGEPAVLTRSCVAIVGSRRPSRAAERAARALAADLAAQGVTVVSGGAAGIDTAAHQGAVSTGATAVVPSGGVWRFTWRGIEQEDLRPDAWCVVGQFPPHEGWRRQYALIRNRTIVAASEAVAAFDPRDTGGTWHGCVTALSMRKPLFVCSSGEAHAQQRGLKRLVRRGAVALDPSHMPGASEFMQLVDEYQVPPGCAQVQLFDPLKGVG